MVPVDARVVPRVPSHQPPSWVTPAFSMTNLPSLYFWLGSYARSYFQPISELQDRQCASRTEC